MSLKRLKAPHSAVRQVISTICASLKCCSEPREDLVARAVPVVGDGDGIFHHQLVHLVQLRMGLVVEQPGGTRLRDALHGQLRRMVGDAIGALVDAATR